MTATEPNHDAAACKWISIVGARPQFVKLAPICRAIKAHNAGGGSPRIEHCIVHTGQHYDHEVAELLFVQMAIPEPKYNLGVGSGTHGKQLAGMLEKLEIILLSERPDWVVTYGDTNSTLAGALIGARLQIPIAHVEAGCRSWDMGMPEEQSRITADHLSRLLLAPSAGAVQNLLREGIGTDGDPLSRRVAMVGDVMYDALLQNLPQAEERAKENLSKLGLKSKGYYLLTLHRAENTNNPGRLEEILDAAAGLEMPVLFPVHPRTKNILSEAGISIGGALRPLPPVGYLEMLGFEKHARTVLTDSGGVQKEAFYLDVPCVTVRDRTEWPETVELGANRIGGVTSASIHAAVQASKDDVGFSGHPFGDGTAAEKIVDELLKYSDSREAIAKAAVSMAT
jgi:UDP-N-acetylglucosamine 2-epimerase